MPPGLEAGEEDAFEVGVDDEVVLLGREILARLDERDTLRVDQHVEPAVRLRHLVDDGLEPREIGHVLGIAHRPRIGLAQKVLHLVHFARGLAQHSDAGAGLLIAECYLAPDAARAADHEGHFVLKGKSRGVGHGLAPPNLLCGNYRASVD